jgi:hypothetical protein
VIGNHTTTALRAPTGCLTFQDGLLAADHVSVPNELGSQRRGERGDRGGGRLRVAATGERLLHRRASRKLLRSGLGLVELTLVGSERARHPRLEVPVHLGRLVPADQRRGEQRRRGQRHHRQDDQHDRQPVSETHALPPYEQPRL